MGLFDLLFSSPYRSQNPNKSSTRFHTRDEIKRALYQISSLNQHQREEVLEILMPYLMDSDPGVQVSEIEEYIMKKLSHLRQRNGGDLSDVDWEKLRELLLGKVTTKVK